MNCDFLIVGAGIFGCTVARQLTDAGKKCLVIEKRPYISGNCWSNTVDGIEVHRHGPHIFHTDSARIWEYVNRFASFRQYSHRLRAMHKGKVYSFPINLMTLQQVWGVVTPAEALAKLERVRIPRPPGRTDLESWALSNMGYELYEMFIKGYTLKQWGRPPAELPETIIQRVPFRITFDDRHFDDEFEGLPNEGFVGMAAKMLEGIEVRLNCDFLGDMAYWKRLAPTIIYSGPLDRLFDFDRGRLEYRSLRFEEEQRKGTFQGCPVINYPDPEVPWTRITEYKFFMREPDPDRTVIVREFPEEFNGSNEAYYPIDNAPNRKLADEYAARAAANGIIPGGRLGAYRYYSIHHVIGQALSLSERLLVVKGGSA